MADTATKLDSLAGLEVVEAGVSEGFIKFLVYADPGGGKTWLVASAQDVPKMRPILFIDMEGGIASAGKKWPGMHVVRIKDTIDESTGRVTKMAWDHLYGLYEHLKTRKHPYKTIILDSVSEAYALCMRWVMYDLIVVKGKDHRDPDIADKKEYAKARSRVHLMMRAFRDLDAHVLMTALKDVKTNNDTGALINNIPSLPGKLAYEVGGFMDLLGYLYVEVRGEEVTRHLLTVPANKYLAKDRYDALPSVVDEPTMPKLAAAILGKEETKPAPGPKPQPATITK